jgi:hypothetical protein
MVQSSASANKAKIALLDSASTHTVLQDQTHFEFKLKLKMSRGKLVT